MDLKKCLTVNSIFALSWQYLVEYLPMSGAQWFRVSTNDCSHENFFKNDQRFFNDAYLIVELIYNGPIL